MIVSLDRSLAWFDAARTSLIYQEAIARVRTIPGVATGIGKLASGLLYQVSPFDPIVLTVAGVVLTTVALAACYVPARRAMRVTPLET